MGHWRYRAFTESLQVKEGVLIGPSGDDDSAVGEILLRLRNQGLQGIALTPITRAEYANEMRLLKLKERLNSSGSPFTAPR